MEGQILEAIRKAGEDAGVPLGIKYVLEWPADLSHGDYSTNIAFAAASMLGKSPKAIADEILPLVKTYLGEIADTVTVAGPGFINIKLSGKTVALEIEKAAALGAEWGKGDANKDKRVVVEYSNPNPFKEMHIGHLMSTVIGEALARSIENSGAVVIRDSYGGDVGPHVAKALWGLKDSGIGMPANASDVGKAYTHGSRAYEESEGAKAEIDELNTKIYEGTDTEVMELWRVGREVCLSAFRDIYKVLGTNFDYFLFESETAAPGMELVQRGLKEGIFKESEGAVIYDGEAKGLHTLVFVTSRGTPTYETKDLGLAIVKEERIPNDRSIIVTAAEQTGHFNVFLAALSDLLPALAEKTSHFPHGFLRLTTGKMSSREGTVITAASLINDTIEKVSERSADPLIAEQVAIGAIKYSILKQSAGSDIIFDMEKSLSLEGDSGPYLQYALVRAKKILSYESESGGGEEPDAPYAIERLVIRYPEVAARAEREQAPHHIAQYLTHLAAAWNSFYANEQVLGSEQEKYKQRLARAFANTMTNGLATLGIPTPDRM